MRVRQPCHDHRLKGTVGSRVIRVLLPLLSKIEGTLSTTFFRPTNGQLLRNLSCCELLRNRMLI